MTQDYLVAWMNWYYGDGPYPPLTKLQDQMTYNEKMEAISKTEQIKKIVGRSR